MAAFLGWSCVLSFCMINHCCFIIVNAPASQILPLYGRYKLKIKCLLFCLAKIVMKVYLPIPEGTLPLCSIMEEPFWSNHCSSPYFEVDSSYNADYDTQWLIFCFFQVFWIICLNLISMCSFQETLVSVNILSPLLFNKVFVIIGALNGPLAQDLHHC